MKKGEKFITTELALASALISKGFDFEGSQGNDPRRLEFVFTGSTDILMAEAQYYRGELHVEASGFHNALRLLKRQISKRRRQAA